MLKDGIAETTPTETFLRDTSTLNTYTVDTSTIDTYTPDSSTDSDTTDVYTVTSAYHTSSYLYRTTSPYAAIQV